MDINFELVGSGEFAEAMEKAMKQFPASAEKVLRKEEIGLELLNAILTDAGFDS